MTRIIIHVVLMLLTLQAAISFAFQGRWVAAGIGMALLAVVWPQIVTMIKELSSRDV